MQETTHPVPWLGHYMHGSICSEDQRIERLRYFGEDGSRLLRRLLMLPSQEMGRAKVQADNLPRGATGIRRSCEGAAAGHPGVPRAAGPRLSPVDAALLRRKLSHIAECLEALRPLAGVSLAEYRVRLYERKAADRLPAGGHRGRARRERPPRHRAGSPGARRLLSRVRHSAKWAHSRDLAERLAPSAGLRNRLVHEYDILADGRVLASIARVPDKYRVGRGGATRMAVPS
jgi:hypothetical protein